MQDAVIQCLVQMSEMVKQIVWRLLRRSLRTAHNRIVLCGLLVGLFYLPAWLWSLLESVSSGAAFPFLVVTAAYLALQELWHQRNTLAKLTASVKQRRLGYILILIGVGLFPFFRFAFWSQALLWFLILVGIALSSWGINFFRKYPLPTFLILLSVHPGPNSLIGRVWTVVDPYNTPGRFTAWIGSLALQAIGQPATSTDNLISLNSGGVEIGWGCTGFDMAITMATTGFLFSLILKRSWRQTAGIVILGIALAFVLNIPRVVLLTMAAALWGKKSFEFWHGFWGGQIFSAILFTTYYYLVMSIFPQRDQKLRNLIGKRK